MFGKSRWSELRVHTRMNESDCNQLRQLFSGPGFSFDVRMEVYGSEIDCYVYGDGLVVADWRKLWQRGECLEVSLSPKMLILASNRFDSGVKSLEWIDRQISGYDVDYLRAMARGSYEGKYGKGNKGKEERMLAGRAYRRDLKNDVKNQEPSLSADDITYIRNRLNRSQTYRLYTYCARRYGKSYLYCDMVLSTGNWSTSIYVLCHHPNSTESQAIYNGKKAGRSSRVVVLPRESGEDIEAYFIRLQKVIPSLQPAVTKLDFHSYMNAKYGKAE